MSGQARPRKGRERHAGLTYWDQGLATSPSLRPTIISECSFRRVGTTSSRHLTIPRVTFTPAAHQLRRFGILPSLPAHHVPTARCFATSTSTSRPITKNQHISPANRPRRKGMQPSHAPGPPSAMATAALERIELLSVRAMQTSAIRRSRSAGGLRRKGVARIE